MKKILMSLVAALTLVSAAAAQDYDATAGFRIGYGAAFTTELSGQLFINDINRIEVDLGLRFRNTLHHNTDKEVTYPTGPILTGAYHWHWFLAGGFGVYGGPAIQLSLPYWHHFSLGLGGQIGLDYQFDAPFQVSLDFRPIYHLFGYYRGFDPNVGVSLRYAF